MTIAAKVDSVAAVAVDIMVEREEKNIATVPLAEVKVVAEVVMVEELEIDPEVVEPAAKRTTS